ncbi:unnamed protein product, partial [Amoebophrya sp. A25]
KTESIRNFVDDRKFVLKSIGTTPFSESAALLVGSASAAGLVLDEFRMGLAAVSTASLL